MSGNNTSVFGIYNDRAAVERAVESLRDVGFRSVDISVLFAANVGSKDLVHEKATKAPEGATAGGGTGALVGGALGWLAGIGALTIPGVGPFIAAGPIMAALAGGAVGGAVGGSAGALIGLGIPEVRSQAVRRQSSEGRSSAVRSLRRCRVDQAGKGSARANGRRGHRVDGRKAWRLPEVRSADASRVHLAGSGGAAGTGPVLPPVY